MQATHQATSVDLRRLNSHVYVASNDGARCNLDPASPSYVPHASRTWIVAFADPPSLQRRRHLWLVYVP